MPLNFKSAENLTRTDFSFLENSIERLFSACSFSEKAIFDIQNELFQRHSEAGRHYHDLSHLYNLLVLKEEFSDELVHPLLIEAAIWFHDAIYYATKKNNEAESANFALKTLKNKRLPFDLMHLKLLIESTAIHQPLVDHSDFDYFLDFDLAILASERTVYQTYTEAIRQEYSIYPDLWYRPERKKVLQQFLERERIYFSEHFFERFEEKARENLREEIQNLE